MNYTWAIIFATAVLNLAGCATSSGLSNFEFNQNISSKFLSDLEAGNNSVLLSPGQGRDTLKYSADLAKLYHSNLKIEPIDPSVHYSVILQVGHFPRQRGATGSTGKYVSEQEASALIVSLLSQKLGELDISHAIIDADSYRLGPKIDSQHYFKTDIFLSFHMDGSTVPCRSAPSLGYNPKFGKKDMSMAGVALAISLGLNARDFMRDNFTKNLSHFYSYRHSNTQIAEGILEMSELSCPEQEIAFLSNSEAMAKNIATAITFMLAQQG